MTTTQGPKIVARVTNDAGRSFNVLLVRCGDRYGLNDKLTHEGTDPLVEFWDATYEDDSRFTLGRGQFVARYYLSTLNDRRYPQNALDLCGHEPVWKVTGQNVVDVLEAIETCLHGDVETKMGSTDEDRERKMFGCTAASIDEVLDGKSPRDVAMYAMGTLSNAQEMIRRRSCCGWTVSDRDADTIRQLMNIAKYAIDKAVTR